MSAPLFDRVSSIRPELPDAWRGRLFLTFDFDWAADEVLSHTVDLIEAAGVPATWFVTHDTPVLARLRANPRFELGIHPNFNPLLGEGAAGATHPEKIVAALREIVPEARVVRSHSLVQSSHLLDVFRRAGLDWDCNVFVPPGAGALRPWRHWNGLVRVPYCWEDDVSMLAGGSAPAAALAAEREFAVFDFHPIHVALNSESLGRYERCRPERFAWPAVRRERNPGRGIEDELRDLLSLA